MVPQGKKEQRTFQGFTNLQFQGGLQIYKDYRFTNPFGTDLKRQKV